MSVIQKDLGAATAYGYAVEKGYTGTEAEFAELMADYANVGQRAEDAADSASESKSAAQTAATTATNKASEATTAAQTATTKAEEASTSASTATSAKDTAVSASQTATTKATEATTAAATAVSAKDDAVAANTAAQSAKTAAQTAQTGAETAAASVQSSAAQIAANAGDITQLKEDLHKFKNEVCEITTGDNLCDPDALTIGYLNGDGTINSALDYYETTDYIPVEVGKTYFIVGFGSKYGNSAQTRYLCLLYDEDKNPISGTFVNTDNVKGISVTVSADNAYYLRACGHLNKTEHVFQVEVGDAITYMKRYKQTVSNIMELPQLDDLKPLVGIATKVTGSNLLNLSNKVVGFISGNSGIITENDTYWTTDYIPVKANQAYIFSQTRYNGRMIVLLYDEDKNAIPSTYVNNPQTMEIAFTPSVDGFVRLSTTVSIFNSGNSMLTEGSSIPSAYIPYKENYVLSDKVVFPESATENTLRGKMWCHCGDSFSASTDATFDSGIYSGKNRVFSRLIALRNGMTLMPVFFGSGRTLAYPTDGNFPNSLTNPSATYYYQNIPEDVDYITIMLGINDSHHENGIGGDGEDPTGIIPIGTISDLTTATYYGAWNVVLSWLIAHRPFAHIGIIVSNGCDREAYRTAQIEIARKYGVPFIDLNGDDRTPVMIRSQNPNIASSVKAMLVTKQAIDPDGSITGAVNTHPNWKAHEYESTFIEDFLRSI